MKHKQQTFIVGKLQIVVVLNQVIVHWLAAGINNVHNVGTAKSTLQQCGPMTYKQMQYIGPRYNALQCNADTAPDYRVMRVPCIVNFCLFC